MLWEVARCGHGGGAYRSNADAVSELVICSDVVQILADSPLPQLLHMPGFRIPAIAGRVRDLM